MQSREDGLPVHHPPRARGVSPLRAESREAALLHHQAGGCFRRHRSKREGERVVERGDHLSMIQPPELVTSNSLQGGPRSTPRVDPLLLSTVHVRNIRTLWESDLM